MRGLPAYVWCMLQESWSAERPGIQQELKDVKWWEPGTQPTLNQIRNRDIEHFWDAALHDPRCSIKDDLNRSAAKHNR